VVGTNNFNEMKKKLLQGTFALFILLSTSFITFSQTGGNLTFNCTTTAPSGNWGNKHVLAIWIENAQSPSSFIKTKSKYGYEDDHLTAWGPKSGKNLVDAVTGATLSSYGTQSVIWDGTDISHVVVADGTYKVFIEMGWGKDKVLQHAVTSFTFNKGATAFHAEPSGDGNYSNISIDWTPTVTFSNTLENAGSILVFPNPTNGVVRLDFKQSIQSAKITVESELGGLVYSKNLENNFNGLFTIDLSSFANGLYFVKVISPNQKYLYKVVLNH